MNETCMPHDLNMPDIGTCPYCEIERQKILLEDLQRKWLYELNKAEELYNKICFERQRCAEKVIKATANMRFQSKECYAFACYIAGIIMEGE